MTNLSSEVRRSFSCPVLTLQHRLNFLQDECLLRNIHVAFPGRKPTSPEPRYPSLLAWVKFLQNGEAGGTFAVVVGSLTCTGHAGSRLRLQKGHRNPPTPIPSCCIRWFVRREATTTTSVIQGLWRLDLAVGGQMADKASPCREGSVTVRNRRG